MHVILRGKSAENPSEKIERRWFIIARDGDGPHIPTIPAILLAERLALGEKLPTGAYPCMGLVNLEDYVTALSSKNIEVITECARQ